jgi:hypothetical protein
MILREVQRLPKDNSQYSEAMIEDNLPSSATIFSSDVLDIADEKDMDDWEEGLNNDYTAADDEEAEENEICAAERPEKHLLESDTKGPYNIVLSSEIISAAQKLLLCLQNSETQDFVILEKFQTLILAVFTSQTADAAIHHFFTPLETYFMSMALTSDGAFRNAVQISPLFSKIQYLCLFSILLDAKSKGDLSYRYVVV